MKHVEPAGLSGHAVSRLRRYADLLLARAVPLGFVSRKDRDRIFDRHVMDSVRAVGCMGAEARSVVDVGSGAGLPGIPVAIMRPDVSVMLVEPLKKRAAFLEYAVLELALPNVRVTARRAEEVDVSVDVALARALGPAATSWRLSEPLLRTNGALVYFAGGAWGEEDLAKLQSIGVVVTICETAAEGTGPLVMMRRVVDSSSGRRRSRESGRSAGSKDHTAGGPGEGGEDGEHADVREGS